MDTLRIVTETKVTRRVDLGDYEEAYRGAVFDVWVTPPRAHLEAFAEYTRWLNEQVIERSEDVTPEQVAALYAEMYERLDGWLAETWLNIPLEEVTAIREKLQADDLHAWEWLYSRTLEAITEYKETRAKN